MKEYKTEKMKITSDELSEYSKMIIDQIAKGQSISTSIISVGLYILLNNIGNTNRPDLIGMGVLMVLIGYVYNYHRAKKKIKSKEELMIKKLKNY